MVALAPKRNSLKVSRHAKALPCMAIDAGNANLKWGLSASDRGMAMTSSWAKKLPGYQTLPPTAITTEVNGERWVFGPIAEDLGGEPMFRLGKEKMYPIFIKALFEYCDITRVEELYLLVPSQRNIETLWQAKVEPVIREYVNVGRINFIPEGTPPYAYACSQGLWKWPQYPQGVLDCGGGELSLILFTRSGVIDADKSLLMPGTSVLAQRIANAIAGQTSYQPNPGTILSAIEDQTYNYIDKGQPIEFKAIFDALKKEWLNEIKTTILQEWQQSGVRFGQILMVGGGSVHLLQELMGQDKPYLLPSNEEIKDFPQLLNVYSMLQMAEVKGA